MGAWRRAPCVRRLRCRLQQPQVEGSCRHSLGDASGGEDELLELDLKGKQQRAMEKTSCLSSTLMASSSERSRRRAA